MFLNLSKFFQIFDENRRFRQINLIFNMCESKYQYQKLIIISIEEILYKISFNWLPNFGIIASYVYIF